MTSALVASPAIAGALLEKASHVLISLVLRYSAVLDPYLAGLFHW